MENDAMREEMEKMRKLKHKYEEMTKIIERERSELETELTREK